MCFSLFHLMGFSVSLEGFVIDFIKYIFTNTVISHLTVFQVLVKYKPLYQSKIITKGNEINIM